jgi:hypothetical protein
MISCDGHSSQHGEHMGIGEETKFDVVIKHSSGSQLFKGVGHRMPTLPPFLYV